MAYFQDGGTKIQDGRHKKNPSDQEMKILHDTKQLKTSKIVLLDEIYHKIILVALNQPYLIIKEFVLKGTEMVCVWGGGVSKTV